MKPHLSKWTKNIFRAYFIIAAIAIAMLSSCNKKDKPSSPNSNPDTLIILPLTPYNPQPLNGATGIDENVTFTWQCNNPDSGVIHYKVFLGMDSLREVKSEDTAKCHIPIWPKQAKAKEMLVQIYEMQKAYRTRQNSYCLNGVCASRSCPNTFNLIGIRIDTADCYTYTLISAINTFSCTGTGRYDTGYAPWDVWAIDETGFLQHECNIQNVDADFQPSIVYSWRVLAYKDDGDSAYSPIWHFTTDPNLIVPGYSSSPPNFEIPANNYAAVNCSTVFSWYCSNPQRNSLTYDYYLGLGDNLQIRSQNQQNDNYVSDWRNQNDVRRTLIQIYSQEHSYRERYDCYCCNGISSTYHDINFLRHGLYAALLYPDPYTYTITSTCWIFTCTANANLDCDPTNDIWTIDQDGNLINQQNDCDVPFIPGSQYSWKVIAHDGQNREFDGPVWHFVAGLDSGM